MGLRAWLAVGLAMMPVAVSADVRLSISETMAGLNGDSRVQFVELRVPCADARLGPMIGSSVGRAMLTFHAPDGSRSGRYVFPANPAAQACVSRPVLVATDAFAAATGIAPDFTMPPLVEAVAGSVCVRANPDAGPPGFAAHCVSYGGAAAPPGADAGAIARDQAALPVTDRYSLARYASGEAEVYGLSPEPTPSGTAAFAVPGILENAVGAGDLPALADDAAQGRVLFVSETFRGNGRTCSTCHVPALGFGLTAEGVAVLPHDDVLFMNELDVNTLVVSPTRPSDFRRGQKIWGSLGGSARVLAGTGDTYLVHGGADLAIEGNLVSDVPWPEPVPGPDPGTGTGSESGRKGANPGNFGRFISFTAGDLDAPAPANPDPFGIEVTGRLRGSRALIVENINGVDRPSVLRASPSLLNIGLTAPLGLSSEIPDLDAFSVGAVAQHAPRSLLRRPGIDFRVPTADEQAKMTAFMETIRVPADGDHDFKGIGHPANFDRFATTVLQKRGREVFFGSAGCGVCHNGPVLATSDGRFGTTAGVNEEFDTGVSRLPVNTAEALPSEEDVGMPANTRAFSTQQLFGVRHTAPYFHDASVADLRSAILFYDSPEFRSSPAAAQVGAPQLSSADVTAMAAFLDALVDRPFRLTTALRFPAARFAPPLEASLTNTGEHALTIVALSVRGPDAESFVAEGPFPESGPVAPGESRQFRVRPLVDDLPLVRTASLELRVLAAGEAFDVGVALEAMAPAAMRDCGSPGRDACLGERDTHPR